MKNYYSILGVETFASIEEVKRAYVDIMLQYALDTDDEGKYVSDKFLDITIAYETLTNVSKRNDYNRILMSVLDLEPTSKATSNTIEGFPGRRAQKNCTHLQQETIDRVNNEAIEINEEYEAKTSKINFQLRRYKTIAAVVTLSLTLLTGYAAVLFYKTLNKIPTNTQNNTIGLNNKSDLANTLVKPTDNDIKANNENITKDKDEKKTELQQTTIKPVTTKTNQRVVKTTKQVETKAKDNEETIDFIPLINTFDSYPQIGATKTETLKSMGTPNAIIRFDDKIETWKYEDKNIHFNENRIVLFNLISKK